MTHPQPTGDNITMHEPASLILAADPGAAILRAVSDQSGAPVTRDSELRSLDLDSLDVIEVVQRVNDELGIALDPFALRGAVTIGDLIDAVPA